MPSQPFSFNIIFTIPQLFISQYVWKWLSSISFTFELMNRHSGINDNNNNDNKKDRTKQATTAAAIPMVGAIVTAALLLSGLSLISSYQQPAIAQQNMTEVGGGNATNMTAAGNVTNATAAGNVTNATAAGN